jgi:cytosine/creatinine deaminase
MFDLLVKGGTLPDGTVADIGITGDRIAAVGKLEAGAARVIDATGDLVAPPFVDPHFHMDATLSYGLPRVNASGTLLEGIGLWGELRDIATVEEMVTARSPTATGRCRWAFWRSVPMSTPHPTTCARSRRCWRSSAGWPPTWTCNSSPSRRTGFTAPRPAARTFCARLDMGVDVVGGIPHFERTMEEGAESLRDLARIAAERGLMWDVHCDETDDPMSRHVETMAREVTRHGLGGRAAGSHLTSMHSMDNYYVSKLLPLIAESGMTAIPNPLINITLQGRHDTYPKRRGLTRVKEMQAMGIPVGWGQDCVLDPWYSLGTADMLDVAFMGLHVAQMTHPAEMARCFNMVTEVNAQIMGLQDYGLKPGCLASLVVLDAGNPTEALRLRPDRLAVVSRGKVVSERGRNDARLSVDGRPGTVRRRLERRGSA